MSIVLRKPTNEYFQYLFASWDCPRTKLTRNGQILLLYTVLPKVERAYYNGVFAPNSKHRAQVTPARRGKVKTPRSLDENQTPAERRAAMTWAQRLKRVFDIDIETCSKCGGEVRIIASIEDPEVIRKILAHLDEKVTPTATGLLPESRAPPATGLFA